MIRIEEFLKRAKDIGWEVRYREKQELNLPYEILSRYTNIPNEFLRFLELADECVTKDEKSWFLCINDYKGTSDSAFSWDEFEKISLEAAEDDNQYKQEIVKFWDGYLPIAFSLGNGYGYYALDVKNDFGSVVYGYEPEFEEPDKVAASFLEFLEKIIKDHIQF